MEPTCCTLRPQQTYYSVKDQLNSVQTKERKPLLLQRHRLGFGRVDNLSLVAFA
jgi:hypothetical protein